MKKKKVIPTAYDFHATGAVLSVRRINKIIKAIKDKRKKK